MKIYETDFLIQNLWWIVFIGVIVLGGIIFLLSHIAKKNKKQNIQVIDAEDSLKAIGGKENVLSHSIVGSRIMLSLKDYSKVDKEKLKNAGAVGFVMKSDKLTIVFKDKAQDVYNDLFGK